MKQFLKPADVDVDGRVVCVFEPGAYRNKLICQIHSSLITMLRADDVRRRRTFTCQRLANGHSSTPHPRRIEMDGGKLLMPTVYRVLLQP